MAPSNFSYHKHELSLVSNNNREGLFDFLLEAIWEAKMKEGLFRYELGDLRTKCLPGKYKFIVQLNIKRALERRKPECVTDVQMEFDSQKFHFGKVDQKEKIFNIFPFDMDPIVNTRTHPIMINISPLEHVHCLFVPFLEDHLPQVLSLDPLRIAMELMLISKTSYFRMGFNSLGGFASVNNLHFHSYYLKYNLYLETAVVKQLKGPCYKMKDFPAEGFVFEVTDRDQVVEVARSVLLLTNFLIENKIAHNVFITRALPFNWPIDRQNPSNQLYSLRIYVWAREACFGVKDEMAFNIAVCELAGHIPMKDEGSFENITEDEIAARLHNVCHDTFISIKEQVKKLY